MWFKRKKERKIIWTEKQIDLYERQMAARDALGTKYICHPTNNQRPMKKRSPRELEITYYPAPCLRLVK
jgi:hypothetical protein